MNLFEKMSASSHVRVNETMPGVFACNFTRKAFHKGLWDEQTVKARGLFLSEDGRVLARGFDKFFGIGDHNGPTLNQFLRDVTFPVTVQQKDNGYLAIVASINNNLQVFSKSGVTDYSKHAEKILFKRSTPEALDALETVLSTNNMSLAVEIIDPYSDPHIELYDDPHGVILAGIKNQEEFEIVDQKVMDLIEFIFIHGFKGGVYISDHTYRMNSQAYSKDRIVELIDEVEYQQDSEGLVFRDATGKMWKYKTRWYKKVKSVRNSLNRTLKGESDEVSGKILNALSDMGRSLGDYRVTDISGRSVLDLPRMASDLEPEFFFDEID